MSAIAATQETPTTEGLILDFIRDEVVLDPGFEVAPEENLFTTGILDSVSIMRLVDHLETNYGFTVPPIDFVPQNFRSIGAMSAYVNTRISAKS